MGDVPVSRSTGEVPSSDKDDRASQLNSTYGVVASSQANYPNHNAYSQQSMSPMRSDSFNMNQFGASLPSYQEYSNHPTQRYSPSPSIQNYQPHNMHQFSSSPNNLRGHNSVYGNNLNTQYQGQYIPSQASSQNIQLAGNPGALFYNAPGYGSQAQQQQQQQQQQGQAYYIQHNQYMPQSPVFPVMPSPQFVSRGAFSSHLQQNQQRGKEFGFGSQGRSNSMSKSTYL